MTARQFGAFRFDSAEQLLTDGAQSIVLSPTEATLLDVFLASRGAVLTTDDLLKRVWPGVHVSRDTVARQVSRLRTRLGEAGGRSTTIATVSRRGYRLLVPVSRVRHRVARPATRQTVESLAPIAILPLSSTDESLGAVAHGLTERIIDRLSTVPGVRVVGLASVLQFSGRSVAPAEVGTMLRARSVLTGSVVSVDNRLTLALELSAGEDWAHVWSWQNTIDRRKAHLLEGRLLRKFLAAFEVDDGQRPHSEPPTSNTEAYELLLKGSRLSRQLDALSNLHKAAECLSEAIRLDPRLKAAHLALADVHLKMRFLGEAGQSASQAARRGVDAVLKLDPRCAPALAMRATLVEEMDWDRASALETVERAAKLGPNDPIVQFWCGQFFSRRGQYARALAHLDAGLTIDPFSLDLLVGRLYVLVLTGRAAMVDRQVAALARLMPGGVGAIGAMAAYAYASSGRRALAITTANRVLKVDNGDPAACVWAAMSLARAGVKAAARDAVRALERRRANTYVPTFFLAAGYAAVGDREKALSWLEHAADERSTHILYAASEPWFRSLRRTRRFQQVMRRIQVPR